MTRHSRRARLVSESASTDQHHNEPLKGILKNSRIPTKRSVSECVNDLSQIMEDMDINIDYLKSRRFCPMHPFPEQVEYDEHEDSCNEHEEDDESEDEHDDDQHDVIENDKHIDYDQERNKQQCDVNEFDRKTSMINENNKGDQYDDKIYLNNNKLNQGSTDKGNIINEGIKNAQLDDNNGINSEFVDKKKLFDTTKNLKGCSCYDRYRSDSSDGSNYSDTIVKPSKKSVRFNDHVYETVYIASRLYDRRAMAKYRFSTRHHPPPNGNNKQNKKQSKKRTAVLSKSETKPTTTPTKQCKPSDDKGLAELSNKNQAVGQINGCKQTKSQRAKQSKKDKLKSKLNRTKDESCSSDDQGYGSSIINFSD